MRYIYRLPVPLRVTSEQAGVSQADTDGSGEMEFDEFALVVRVRVDHQSCHLVCVGVYLFLSRGVSLPL